MLNTTTTRLAMAALLAWMLCPSLRFHTATAVVLLFMALLVGISRLYLQVHFASDVMFGAAAAVFWVLALRSLPIWTERTARDNFGPAFCGAA